MWRLCNRRLLLVEPRAKVAEGSAFFIEATDPSGATVGAGGPLQGGTLLRIKYTADAAAPPRPQSQQSPQPERADPPYCSLRVLNLAGNDITSAAVAGAAVALLITVFRRSPLQ